MKLQCVTQVQLLIGLIEPGHSLPKQLLHLEVVVTGKAVMLVKLFIESVEL